MPNVHDSFVCLCVPKSLELGGDHHLHRATKAQELKDEIERLVAGHDGEGAKNVRFAFQEGGGIAAIGSDRNVHTAVVGDAVCVFQGLLKNLDQLVAAHHPTAAHYSVTTLTDHTCSTVEESPQEGDAAATSSGTANGNSGKVPQPPPKPNAAEMVLHLYAAMGMPMLAHLQGRFAFCMYDAKTMRVLAARDGSGDITLFQGRSGHDSLVIASRADLLSDCHEVLEFQPGFFKYGWHADPRLLTQEELSGRTSRSNSRRSSIDHSHVHDHGRFGSNHGRSSGSRRGSIDQGHGPAEGRNSPGLNARRSLDVSGPAWGHREPHTNGHHGTGHGGSANGSRRTSIDAGRSSAHAHGPSPLKPPSKPASPAPADLAAHVNSLHLNPGARAFVPNH